MRSLWKFNFLREFIHVLHGERVAAVYDLDIFLLFLNLFNSIMNRNLNHLEICVCLTHKHNNIKNEKLIISAGQLH